jgi:hypothetical protein
MKSAVICVLLAAMFITGSAWADVASVKQAITNYGLTASDSGNTITVTGNVSKLVSEVLDLGNISGLTIDWKANLTVTGGSHPDSDEPMGMISFTGGTFNLSGGTMQAPSSLELIGIIARGDAVVRVNGGVIKSSASGSHGIYAESGMIIDSGEINIPRGTAVRVWKNLTVNNPSVLTGFAYVGDLVKHTVTVYGHAITDADSEDFYDYYEGDDFVPDSFSYVVSSGAVWDIEGLKMDLIDVPIVATYKITVKNGGKLNFKNAEMKFKGSFHVEQDGELNIGVAQGDISHLSTTGGTSTNDGTINIHGKLTNEGTLSNNSTGKITNAGTIDNTGGTIKNEGTFQSAQTAADMGGTVDGDIQPLGGKSSGGGCDAGFGLFGLLLAGLAVSKYRKA